VGWILHIICLRRLYDQVLLARGKYTSCSYGVKIFSVSIESSWLMLRHAHYEWRPAELTVFQYYSHNITEAGRALWVPPLQPLPQQGHPEQGAQGHVQAALGDPQGGDPTASGQPCASAPSLHSTEGLLVFRGNLLCSSLCPWPLILAMRTNKPLSWTCTIWYRFRLSRSIPWTSKRCFLLAVQSWEAPIKACRSIQKITV